MNIVKGREKEITKRAIRRLIIAAVLLVLSGAMMALAHRFPDFFFPGYRTFSANLLGAVSRLTGLVPVAVWDFAFAFLIILFILSFIRVFTYKPRTDRERPSLWTRLFRWFTKVILLVSILAFWFVGSWGLNYYAPPLSEQIGLAVELYTEEELFSATEYYLAEAASRAGGVPRDGEGEMIRQDFYELAKEAGASYSAAGSANASAAYLNKITVRSTVPVKKLVLYGPVLLRTGSNGIFMAFTAEANVPNDCAVPDMPFTMAHEVAHRAGIASEQEANFCAFLACSASSDRRFSYSGYLEAFLYCYNACYRQNPERAKEVFTEGTELVLRDIRNQSNHYRKYDGPLDEMGEKINDAYLKSFSQTGVQSYGEVVDYLIAYYQAL